MSDVTDTTIYLLNDIGRMLRGEKSQGSDPAMTQLELWQKLVDVPDRELHLHAQIRRLEEELQRLTKLLEKRNG